MKKTNKFLVAFASLGMVIAGGAAVAIGLNRSTKTNADTVLAQACDFSAKSAGSTSYTSTWTYGDYSVSGGMNNNAAWTYCRFGGGKSAVLTNKVCYISTNTAVTADVTKVGADVKAIASTQGFTVNSFAVTVASDSAFSNVVDTISGTPSAGSITYFTPTSGTSWGTGKFYKLSFKCTTTSTGSNVGIDINALNLYNEVNFGTLKTISVATAPSKTTYEGGETFSSSGLILTAADTLGVTKSVSSGFTTDYDAHVFSDADIGTKTVTVSYTEGSVTATTTYTITITETPKWQSIFGSGLGFTSEKGSTSTPITGNIAAGEQQQTITKDNLFWTMDLVCSNSGIYLDAEYSTDLALGSTAFPCTTCTFTSGIPYISGALGITKVVVDASAGGTTTLSVAIEGTTIGTAQTLTSSQVAYTFTPASTAFGHITISFSQASTTKWIDIFRVRIYGAVDTATNTGKAYGLAARIEQADACTYSAALDTLKTDYEADTTVKGLVDAITVYDYASTTIKSATVSYRSGSVDCATKMVKIASLIAAQSGAVKLLGGDFEGSSMIIVIVTMAIVLAGGAYLYIRRRKHA
jgi:hypothetical protein